MQHGSLLRMWATKHFNTASNRPIQEEATFTQIARSCRVNKLDVRRILHHVVTKSMFHEPRKGVVVHTVALKLLIEDSQAAY